jgi:hypothetical protein
MAAIQLLPILNFSSEGIVMKRKYIGLALLATSLSGMASATILNYAAASTAFDVQNLSFSTLSGTVSLSNQAFNSPSSTATAQDATGPALTNTGTNSASAVLANSEADATVNATSNNLSSSVYVTSGQASGKAQEVLTFTLTHAGTEEITIPYSLYATAQTQNVLTWNGSSNANIEGTWGTGNNQSYTGQQLSASTGPNGGPVNTSGVLDLVLTNGSAGKSYSVTLTALSTANYTNPNPSPVPELPMPLMLSVGMLVPLIARRSRKFMAS